MLYVCTYISPKKSKKNERVNIYGYSKCSKLISFNVISLQSANTNLDYLFFLLNETTG